MAILTLIKPKTLSKKVFGYSAAIRQPKTFSNNVFNYFPANRQPKTFSKKVFGGGFWWVLVDSRVSGGF